MTVHPDGARCAEHDTQPNRGNERPTMSTHSTIHDGTPDGGHGLIQEHHPHEFQSDYRAPIVEAGRVVASSKDARTMSALFFVLGLLLGFIAGMGTIIIVDEAVALHRTQVVQSAPTPLSSTMRI